MNSSDTLTDNEVAFAAMNLFANKPIGPEPDWQEIHDWHMELLDEARAEQVLSHVANNPEVFQKWQDICEATEFLVQSPTEEALSDTLTGSATDRTDTNDNPAAWDLVGWLSKAGKAIAAKPLPAMGGAVAATFLAVMIVPKLLTSPSDNPGDMINASLAQYSALGAPLPQAALQASRTRSLAGVLGNLSNEEVEKHQLKHGFRQAFDAVNSGDTTSANDETIDNWLLWQETLPESSVDCTLATDEQYCMQISVDMNTLGQWALLNHLACANAATLPDDFQQQQSDIINALAGQETLASSAVVKSQLLNNKTEQPDEKCSQASSLINFASE